MIELIKSRSDDASFGKDHFLLHSIVCVRVYLSNSNYTHWYMNILVIKRQLSSSLTQMDTHRLLLFIASPSLRRWSTDRPQISICVCACMRVISENRFINFNVIDRQRTYSLGQTTVHPKRPPPVFFIG